MVNQAGYQLKVIEAEYQQLTVTEVEHRINVIEAGYQLKVIAARYQPQSTGAGYQLNVIAARYQPQSPEAGYQPQSTEAGYQPVLSSQGTSHRSSRQGTSKHASWAGHQIITTTDPKLPQDIGTNGSILHYCATPNISNCNSPSPLPFNILALKKGTFSTYPYYTHIIRKLQALVEGH